MNQQDTMHTFQQLAEQLKEITSEYPQAVTALGFGLIAVGNLVHGNTGSAITNAHAALSALETAKA